MKHPHGLILGKFYPPHAGHHLLIYKSSQLCERLTVAVSAASRESIPLAQRIAWLQAVHPQPHIEITGFLDDAPVDYDDPAIWDAHMAPLLQVLSAKPPVTAVFSSEAYGDELARRLNATHFPFDPARKTIPVSSTAIRANLPAHWHRLAPAVRKSLACRVVLAGPPQSGKTALAMALAQKLRQQPGAWQLTAVSSSYAPLYAAEKSEQAKLQNNPALAEWTPDDDLHIASTQRAMDDKAASDSAPLLLCDSSVLTALAHHLHRNPQPDPAIQAHLAAQPPQLTLLTHPFENPDQDPWLLPQLQTILANHRLPHLPITGPPPHRLAQAFAAIQDLLAQSWRFTDSPHSPV